MIKKFNKTVFVICCSVLVSKSVYTPVLVKEDVQDNVQTKIFEIA